MRLIEHEARLLAVLESDPDRHFADLLGEGARAVAATSDEADAMRLLRRLKAEASLLIALADIGGVWPVMRVTRAMTELADAAVSAALRHLLNAAVATGKLRPPDPAEPEAGCGLIVLAMGKMGAFELNYSSDIDLIVFSDPTAVGLAPELEAAPFHIRLTRGLVLATAAEDYVQGARALGAGDVRLMSRHVLPNIASSLLVQATISIPIAVIAEAVLSFLGLGVQPPAPSWGTMLNAAQQFLETAPWLAWWPGLAIFSLTLSFNLAGDGLRDLLDPRDY